jgi:predicted PurR-regulated permease PerM
MYNWCSEYGCCLGKYLALMRQKLVYLCPMTWISRNFLYLLGTLVLGVAIWYFSDIVTYLLLAWVLSLLGQPLMLFFLKRFRVGRFRVGPTGAALLTMLVFFLIIAGLLLLFVPTIVGQARNLAQIDYVALGEKFRDPFTYIDQQAHQLGLLKANESLATKTQETLINWFKPALVGDFVGSFISVAGNIVVAVSAISFILFFFLKDRKLFADIIHAFVPTQQEPKVLHAMQESSEALTDYFKGLILQIGAFSLMVTVLLLIMGVPNALLIGVFGGLLNVVPYVGPIIGCVLGCFITISSGLHLEFDQLGPMVLKVVAAFAMTQAVDNLFLSTIIFSKSVNAHPLEIFMVTLMAAKIGGVAGMVLGIPVYTVLRVVAKTFFSEFKVVQRLTDHLDDE